MGNCFGGGGGGDEDLPTSASLKRDDSKRPKMGHQPSIKGPMTKYMLRFDKVKEVYSLVEKSFKTGQAGGGKNSKSKFHSKVPCKAIEGILADLGVPKFDNMPSLLEKYYSVSTRGGNIDFKNFLIGTGNMVWGEGMKRITCAAKSLKYGATIGITGKVETVEKGSNAAGAGVQAGDRIVEINKHAVKRGGEQYEISLNNSLNSGDKTANIVFLRDLPAGTSSNKEQWEMIKSGFATVEAMFDDIDKDKGGSIDFNEFCEAFNQVHGQGTGASATDMARVEARLKELDFDGNREIDRDEFIFGISAWVGFADDEDLDGDRA